MSQLNKLWSIDAEVRSIQRTIEGLEENMITIRATRIKSVNVQETNKPKDIVEETIMEIDKLKKYLARQVKGLVKLKNIANKKIDKIECGAERAILRDRYFNRMSIEQIANNLHYSSRQVDRYHRRAVRNYNNMS